MVCAMIHAGALKRTSLFAAGAVSAGLLVALLPSASASASVGGAPDPTFGRDGTVVTDITGDGRLDTVADVAVAPDGRIVAVGHTVVRPLDGEEEDQPDHDFVVARYNRDGSLDATFGAGGVVRTSFGGAQSRDEAKAVALQPDGKIVVAGNSDPDLEALGDFALARYNRDGSLDTTFGAGGLVVFDIGRIDSVAGLAIQPNGQIVVAGSSDARGTSPDYDFALARFQPDGSLDTAFGEGGKVLTPFGTAPSMDIANAVAIQPNGRIVVVGQSNAGGSTDFAVARYDRDGALDATFGTGGTVLTDVTGAQGIDIAVDVAVRANGEIVVAGSGGGFSLVRYLRDGTLDPTFGTGGHVNTPLFGRAQAVAIQSDGRIVAAGWSSAKVGSFDRDFTLTRYHRDGSPDTSFGNGGKVATDFSGNGSDDAASALALQPGGGIIVAGSSNSRSNWDQDFALARYLP